MKYISAIKPDQIIHDIPNGITNMPSIVTHVIDVDGVMWGCAYPIQSTALKITRARKRRIEIGEEVVEFEMGEDTTWVRTQIEGRTWMSVRYVEGNAWIREGGTDDWYLACVMELGITQDEVLYPRKKRPVAKHENPIPVAPKFERGEVEEYHDEFNINTLLWHLSDTTDENMCAQFEGRPSYEQALHAVQKAFPNTPVLTGKSGPNVWYIKPATVVVEPKKRSKR